MRLIQLLSLLLLVVPCRAQLDTAYEPDPVFRSIVKASQYIVTAKVLEKGGCVRMEDGVLMCDIKCVVTETFKGALKVNDTITIYVEEYGDLPLGGKYGPEDTVRFMQGRQFTFFLTTDLIRSRYGGTLYEPVDQIMGIHTPSTALKFRLEGADLSGK
jgi:hypothetical protein